MTRTAAGSNGLLRVAGRGRWTPEEEQRKLEGSEGRSAHRGAACRRAARPRCRPQSCTSMPLRSDAPAATAAPCAPPYGAASSAVASRSHQQSSNIALWRHACASPTLSMRALPARAPCERHLNPPSEPARGSLLPPPPPPARGAAAPSSLVVPVISPVIAGRSRRPIHFPQSKIRSRSIVSRSISGSRGARNSESPESTPGRGRAGKHAQI